MLKFNDHSEYTRSYVHHELPLHTGAMSVYPFSHELKARYTFPAVYEEGEICGAIVKGNCLWVPRESVPSAKAPNDFRVSYPIHAINCNFVPRYQGTPDDQLVLCKKSIAYLRQGVNHIFDAKTGYGKTVCGSYIATQLGQPTLIIVTKEDLITQWRDALLGLGVSPSEIGHIQQNTCEWEGKKYVIGMVHSLIIPGRYPEEMYKYFGFVIFDEVHQMASDCFVQSCQLFPAKYRLGFSATPTRKDGKTRLLHWHIGPILVKGNVVPMKPKVLVRQTGWKLPPSLPYSPGRMMLVNKVMAKSMERNKEISNFVFQAYNSDRNCLVMSDLKESHLDVLFHLIVSRGIPGNHIGYYIGGLSKTELEFAKSKRVVLATYKMCSTGTNVPEWDSLVMATPRADVEQSFGRILRYRDGKKQPIILDLVDGDSIFQNFHISRLKQYYKYGGEIVKV